MTVKINRCFNRNLDDWVWLIMMGDEGHIDRSYLSKSFEIIKGFTHTIDLPESFKFKTSRQAISVFKKFNGDRKFICKRSPNIFTNIKNNFNYTYNLV